MIELNKHINKCRKNNKVLCSIFIHNRIKFITSVAIFVFIQDVNKDKAMEYNRAFLMQLELICPFY